MSENSLERIRSSVRKQYGNRAKGIISSCCSSQKTACCSSPTSNENTYSAGLGYSKEQMQSVPEGANMGLGCGNPQALALLQKGEVVLDLGSGGGFDCFLAANVVGPSGKVIGVDMTPEMLSKARENSDQGDYTNVEFRLGEIEHLPVADQEIDIILSNCVINLSPEKEQVYRDAFRVLKPGGRLAISDVLAVKEIPEEYKNDLELLGACISGAETVENTRTILKTLGFEQITITLEKRSKAFIEEFFPESNLSSYISSAALQAVKPLNE